MKFIKTLLVGLSVLAAPAYAQDGCPANVFCATLNDFTVKPLPIALPDFVAETSGSGRVAGDIGRVISANLVNSGLFVEVPREAHIARIRDFNTPVQYANWSPIGARALVTGAVSTTSDGRLIVKFRVWDPVNQKQIGEGQQFAGTQADWRRMAHKVSDEVYTRLTGEGAYFDSRVVFVAETGPKNARQKQLALMDQDGANLKLLTGGGSLVVTPRFSPDGSRIVYTGFDTGTPQVYLLDVNSLQKQRLGDASTITSAPRFSPDGRRVIYAGGRPGAADIFERDLSTGQRRQLTNTSAIETEPSYSPDGSQIVFESDRSGSQQIYVMPAGGGEARRISKGAGRYGTPVWSPRGDLIAFTKIVKGRFSIGVMRTDGSQEQLLTASTLEEGPTWSPNGRVIMYFREIPGATGGPQLWSVDITGRNEKRVPVQGFASDPSWSTLLR